MDMPTLTTRQWRTLPRRGDAAVEVDGLLLVIFHRTQDPAWGMTVSAKIGNAVVRNGVRRRLRVAAHRQLATRSGTWLLIARPGMVGLGADQVEALVAKACVKVDRRLGQG
jgi:ribonuclease P protein component